MNIKSVDGLLQMGHEHHVTGFVVIVVKGKEVNLAEHSAGSNDAFAVDKEVMAQGIDKSIGIGGLSTWSNGGFKRLRNGFPAVFF